MWRHSVGRASDRSGIGVATGHRWRHRRESLSEQDVAATDIQHIAAMFGGDSDQPRVVGRVVVPVIAVAWRSHTFDCASVRTCLRPRGRAGSRALLTGGRAGLGRLVLRRLLLLACRRLVNGGNGIRVGCRSAATADRLRHGLFAVPHHVGQRLGLLVGLGASS
jgi:hypothetical protein